MKSLRIITLLTFVMLAFAISATAQQRFVAQFTGAQETPPSGSTGVGYGVVTLNAAETMITVDSGFSGLGTAASAGHIHTAPVGVAGPVTFGFAGVPAATSGIVPNQTFAITAAQVTDLKTGQMYFNIHTAGFGGGEIRGQILAATCSTAGPIEVEATAGTIIPTAYGTLAAAIAAINAGTHQGTISVEVCASTTEAAAMFLNSNAAAPASYTSIYISPIADGLTISGPTITGRGLIELNGADSVTIDGDNQNSAGINRNLTITNTAAVTVNLTSVIRIAVIAAVPTADNNTFRNLNINGSATGRNAAANTSTLNSENSSFGIYAGGLATAATTAPGPLTSVSTNTAAAGTTINAFNATNNAVNACARGIFFNGAAATVSTLVTIANNTVGGAGVLAGAPPYIAPTTTVYTKAVFVAGTTAVSITGNTIQNILSYVGTTMNGIELNSAIGAGGVTINDNTITGVVNNGTSAANGIALSVSLSNPTVNGNTISNIQAVGGATVAGIILNQTGTAGTVQRNRVSTVYSRGTSGFGSYGINVNSGNAWTLRNNMVWDVNAFLNNGAISTSFGAHGIRVVTGTGHLIQNNSVNLFGAIVGSSSLSMLSSLTLINTASTGMDVRNNILVNTMTGAPAGTPVNCIYLPSGLLVGFNLTTNNNDYFSSLQLAQQGTTAVSGFTIAGFDPTMTVGATNWRTYTNTLSAAGTNDNASIKTDPVFSSSTDLHLTGASPAIDTGATIGAIIDDIDLQVRPNPSTSLYEIGADEFYAAPGILQLSSTTYGGNEGTTLVATVNRVGGSSGIVGATYTLTDGSGVGGGACGVGVDYVNPGPTLVSLGDTVTSAPINVVLCTDVVIDPSETFTITLSLPTGTTLGSPTVATATITDVPPPFSGSYTVGTAGTYPSLTNAGGIFEAINLAGASGPVTINIISNLTGETGANPLNPITGNPAVLIKPSGAPRTISGIAPIAVIRINGADNIRIDGSTAAVLVGGNPALRELTIQNLSTSATAGVIHIGSATESSSGNTIQNVIALGNDPVQTLTGISTGGATPTSTAAFVNNTTRIQNCSIQRVQMGIFTRGISQATLNTGTVISENDLSATGANRVRQYGIFVGNEDGILISQNSIGGIDTTGVGADTFGIAAGIAGISDTQATTTIGVTNALIERNKINGVSQDATFSAAGIAVAGIAGTNTLANNMVTGVISDGDAGDLPAGIFVVGVTGTTTRLYYNSVAMTGDRGLLLTPSTVMNPSLALAITGTDPIVELKNNIFYTTQVATGGGIDATSYGIAMQTTTFVNLDSNFNAFFSSGANDGGFRSGSLDRAADVATEVDYAALAGWRTATGGGATDDFNSAEGDPLFTNPLNDLHVTILSLVVYDKGTPVSTLDDFDGTTRSVVGFAGGVPDIGADEALAPLAANASVSGRVSAANGNGIRNAVIVVTGGNLTQPRYIRTGSFGYYQVDDLEVGQTYVLTVQSKRFVFANPSIVLTVQENVGEVNFEAIP